MPPVYYLAYGSNLHPIRLQERVLSARVVGVVDLPGHTLAFHKRSDDLSGKCLLYSDQGASSKAYGVLYEFDPTQKPQLDAAEGSGKGYFEQQVSVPFGGCDYTAYIYMASSTHMDPTLAPYHWYKNLVVAGARFHALPPDYVANIELIGSTEDPDLRRRQTNEQLLHRMGWV
ncbi:MAG: gamma-glutamylcyclotransferase family protein [Nitrosomonadaceae bacterium]|nr:gamma-glutamylcyclotransferase family protein [Nitrosomonadaceae bacterium]